jgi:hypothetical protein
MSHWRLNESSYLRKLLSVTVTLQSLEFPQRGKESCGTLSCPLFCSNIGQVATLPLISENYEAQAILVYFCSGSSFRFISFGSQTHWRLKLLISPFWAAGLWKGPFPENSSYLVGKDQSWHLVNWPAGNSEGNVVGNQFHNGAHIDSGITMSFSASIYIS